MPAENRYRGYGKGDGKFTPFVIIALCLLGAVIAAVIIGNLLRVWVDDETYSRLLGETTTAGTSSPVKPSYLRDVQAFPFTLGSDPRQLGEHDEASVCINKPDGSFLYASDVVRYLDKECPETPELQESLEVLTESVSYVSGVFFPQAFLAASSDLRYVRTGEECAVMREFLRMGGSEVLLCGIPFENTALDDILAYVSAVRDVAGGAPVGVSVPLSVAKSEGGWEWIGNLLRVCDFCALDLTAAGSTEAPGEWLDDAEYFLTQYDMRLLLAETQVSLIDEANEREIPDLSVIR